jgi:hypothetical protein
MDTLQINHALISRSDIPPGVFRGTFAINQVPISQIKDAPSAAIINTAPSSSEGEHWIALYHGPDKTVELFDSLGSVSIHQAPVESLLQSVGSNIVHNQQRLQSDCSSVCGEYCILYLYCRLSGMLSETFFKKFTKKDLMENDRLVYSIVHSKFDILPHDRPYPVIFPFCVQRSRSVK